MPIKFRCRFCEQFLGISRARAGAIVDCPQCGRSIRVPELDGRTRRMPARPQPNHRDETLISALSELSHLTVDEAPQTTHDPIPHLIEDYGAEPTISTPVRVEAISASGQPPPVEARSEESWCVTSAIADADREQDTVALEDSLSEIAAINELSTSPVSDELLAEMRSSRRSDSWGAVGRLLVFLLALTSGLAGGWWLTREGFLPSTRSIDIAAPDAEQSDSPLTRNDATPTSSTRHVDESGVATDTLVHGRVEYVSQNGNLLPDSGALVMLVPQGREGTSLLDGSNLRLSTDAPDFRATVAAMNVLGATATQADEKGRYAVSGQPGRGSRIIVVSQHRSREPNTDVPREIQEILLNWFEAPAHVVGQLSVVSDQPPESGLLNFRIGR